MQKSIAPLNIEGLEFYKNAISLQEQKDLLNVIADIVKKSPFFQPISPTTKNPMGTMMTNAGDMGWCADVVGGYRYQETHIETGKPWAKMPQEFLGIWRKFTDYNIDPDCCLINHYNGKDSRLGLHKDFGEDDEDAPILSVSLGDSCIFRMGLTLKPTPTKSFQLDSGDIMVMGGKIARNVYHGVDRILYESCDLLKDDNRFGGGGRLNLTFRCVKTKKEV